MLIRSNEVLEAQSNGERIDPRVTRSRQMLEQAFIELMWKDGLEAVTVRDITKKAGVNRATFYAHFEDKYALFTHVIEKELDEVIQTRLPKQATFTPENLKHLVLALIEFFELGNNSGCTSARNQPIRPIVESRAQEQIGALLATWLRATPDLHLRTTLDMTVTLVSWTIFGLSLSYIRGGNLRTDHDEISSAVEVIMHGVTDQAGSTVEGYIEILNHNTLMSNRKSKIPHG